MNQHVSRCHTRARMRDASMRYAFVRGAKFSRSSTRGRARHRGQALLMAVLLMVFAALLGSTFITVVALNLSQTSRNESKRDAEMAARAAIEVTNAQLTHSTQGENWRPEMINPPPDDSDPEYDTYYTPFEQAQGWGRTVDHPAGWDPDNPDYEADWAVLEQAKENGARVFVKFPDPRDQTFSRSKTPSYLVEVSPVTTAGGGRLGSLRIEVIGRADDEDAAFYRSVVYKGTSTNGGPFSYARFDSNYDMQRNKLRVSDITEDTNITPEGGDPLQDGIRVSDASLFETGQTILITQGKAPGALREVRIISAVEPATNTLRVSQDLTNAYDGNSGAQVRAVSTVMTALLDTDFNADVDTGAPYTGENTILEEAGVGGLKVEPSRNGMYFGGGVALEGRGLFELSDNGTTATTDDDTVLVAGQVEEANANADVLLRLTGGTTQPFRLSSDTTAPEDAQKLVQDDTTNEAGVRPITPPRLEGQPGKFSRYLEMTKLADVPGGSQYGYGPGVYIDNRDDIERYTPPTPATGTRVMPIRMMHRLWQRKGLAATEGTIDPAYSGPRGWSTNFQEFVPRGAFVELRGDQIVITRDSYSSTNPVDPARAWKERDGDDLTDPGRRTYRMVLDISSNTQSVRNFGVTGALSPNYTDKPFNGVIFAEGNVRVRGWVTNKDITIVSMGNIFIEGNIVRPATATGARVALLAKKNVVLNPTQFITRVAGAQDPSVTPGAPTITVGANAGDTTATVSSAETVRVGDLIQIDGAGNSWHTVTRINSATLTLTFAPPLGSGAPAGALVRFLSDPTHQTTANIGRHYAMQGANGQALVRDVRFDNAYATVPANTSLTWWHAGQRSLAFTLKNTSADTVPAAPADAQFRIKQNTTVSIPDAISGLAVGNEKTFTGDNFNPPAGFDLLDVNGIAGRDGDSVETLQELANRFNWSADSNGNSLVDNIIGEDDNPYWNILLPGTAVGEQREQPINGAPVTIAPSPVGTVPAWRVAGVGVTGAAPIVTTAVGPYNTYEVPLTVSIGALWNNDAAAVDGVPLNSGSLSYFFGSGFVNDGLDDLATVDESFYQRRDAAGAFQQALLTPYSQSMTSGTGAHMQNSNVMALGTNSYVGMPQYWITAPKLENAWGDNANYNPVAFTVQATIYAQEGSWFVIPVTLNPAVTPLDGTAVESNIASAATTRMRRLNYRVQVVGNIVQNMTPTGMEDYNANPANGDGITRGAMAQWMDSMAYPTAFGPDEGRNNYRGQSWMTVHYEADPVDISVNTGLYLPVSPDLLYVG